MLCYDGSTQSANAIARAGELLNARSAVVVNVWVADENDRDYAERTVAEGVELAEAAGFKARPQALHEQRNVWWDLCSYAREHDVTTMVVGARGRSLIASVLLGSVSSGLVHHASAPVLVVAGSAIGTSKGPVMLCDDGSDGARHAIGCGATLLRGPGVVVSAWRSRAANVPYMAVGGGATLGIATALDEAAEERSQQIAAEGAQVAGAAGGDYTSEALGLQGPAWRGLLDTAADRDASAIVVGSRGLTGIAGALGSVSAAISQHSPRPVLVVAPPDQRYSPPTQTTT